MVKSRPMSACLKYLIATMLASIFGMTAHAGEVRVAVASGVAAPIRMVAEEFQRKTGNEVRLTVAPTSKLYVEIEQGARYDVLVAGNDVLPARLEATRKAVPGTRYTYATRVLALWSPHKGYVDPQGDVLKSNQFKRLSILSPDVQPYGRSALQVLERLGLRESIAGKLVERHGVSDTRRFVSGENTELGFVSLSYVYKNSRIEHGSAWIVPTSLYDPLRLDAVLLRSGADNMAARSFLFYLKGPKVAQVMRSHGFHR